MAHRMHRAQILLEPEQHEALTTIARQEGRSVSDLIREIVRRDLERRGEELGARLRRRQETFERIREFQRRVLDRRGGQPIEIDVVEMIDEMRDERDSHNWAILHGLEPRH